MWFDARAKLVEIAGHLPATFATPAPAASPVSRVSRHPSFKVSPSLSRVSRVSQHRPRKSQNPKPTPTPFRTASGLAVERFNGRIEEVLKTNHFDSALDLEQTLMRYVHLYNEQLHSPP